MSRGGERRFEALEYRADGSVAPTELSYAATADGGWTIERNGQPWLSLGEGYRLLQTTECGVCSTDLDRRHLPFPLPQVIGHELIALDESGARHVVEINASCQARQIAEPCVFCRHGLPTHCPERLVLGIHALPGGFGGWVLAPRHATVAVPERLASRTAVLVEPFAAALHAVQTLRPRDGDSVGVLGPRRLGMLVIAALAATRQRSGVRHEITALARRPGLFELARQLGADQCVQVGESADAPPEQVDVVVDTTGQPACGITRTTELVVDELSIERFEATRHWPDLKLAGTASPPRIAWLTDAEPPAELARATTVSHHTTAAAALARIEQDAADDDLPRADAAVVSSAEQVDDVIRPTSDREVSLVRPRGQIFVLDCDESRRSPSQLVRAVVERGLRVSTSRCGDFAEALELMANTPTLHDLGERMVTHRFDASDLAAALDTARSPSCIKAVVTHQS